MKANQFTFEGKHTGHILDQKCDYFPKWEIRQILIVYEF